MRFQPSAKRFSTEATQYLTLIELPLPLFTLRSSSFQFDLYYAASNRARLWVSLFSVVSASSRSQVVFCRHPPTTLRTHSTVTSSPVSQNRASLASSWSSKPNSGPTNPKSSSSAPRFTSTLCVDLPGLALISYPYAQATFVDMRTFPTFGLRRAALDDLPRLGKCLE